MRCEERGIRLTAQGARRNSMDCLFAGSRRSQFIVFQKRMALSDACVAAQLLAGKATLKITRPCALRSI